MRLRKAIESMVQGLHGRWGGWQLRNDRPWAFSDPSHRSLSLTVTDDFICREVKRSENYEASNLNE